MNIKKEIIDAVNKVSPEMMRNMDELDISGHVPSLCYSIRPIDQKGLLGLCSLIAIILIPFRFSFHAHDC